MIELRFILRFFIACLAFSALWRPMAAASSPETKATSPQVVILKFDDVTTHGAHGKNPVSVNWQRLADYLAANHIKGSFGIICASLEKENPGYFKWIKDLQSSGLIEFWHHGYRERTSADKQGEFESGSWEEQRTIFEKGEALAMAKLGFPLAAFGPHWSGTTEATDQALAAVPSIKIWLYGPKQPKHFRGLSIERIMALENPTFLPDAKKFQELYTRNGAKAPVLVLQGHPNAWTDERWKGFVEIIAFLRSRQVIFMTPSEYLAGLERTAGKK